MGFASRFSAVALALFGSTGTLRLQETLSQEEVVPTECSVLSNADFDFEVTVGTDLDFDIRWSVDRPAETISFEVFTPAEAWVGVGFTSIGEMPGADAVIGLPDEMRIDEYDLMDRNFDDVNRYEDQEITGAIVSQNATGTTITFTRPLDPNAAGKETLSATPGDLTWFIYAFGSDNLLDNHGSDNRGSVRLDLFCGGGAETDAPTATPIPDTDAPTATPMAGTNAPTGTTIPDPDASTATPILATAPPDAGPVGGEPTTTPTTSPTPVGGSAAFRVNGGLWVAVATVTAAVLGAAMAV